MFSKDSSLVIFRLSTLVILFAGILVFTWIYNSNLAEPWKIFISQLVSVFVIAVGFNYIWEEYSKEKLKQEILGAKLFADKIKTAGLIDIPSNNGFSEEIDWERYFAEVHNLDIFVSYAYSWRNQNRKRIKDFAQREGTEANIILPNYDNREVVSQLASWFGKDEDYIKNKIKESAEDFEKMLEGGKVNYNIYLANTTPVYSFYRFDHRGIMAIYKHHPHKSGVPSFVFKRQGELYSFISKDLDYLISESIKFSEKE